MADQPNTTDTTAPVAATVDPAPVTPPATPAAPAVKTFTQEELDRIVKERLERDRANRKPEPPARAEPKPQPAATADGTPMTREEWEREADRREDFARATHGLAPQQIAFLRTAMKAANPSDVATWCEEAKSTLGLGKPPAPPAVQPAAPAAPAAAAPEAPKPPAAAPAAPSPSNLPTLNGVVDPFALTPDQIRSLGPMGIRKAIDALADIGKQMSGRPQRPVLSRK